MVSDSLSFLAKSSGQILCLLQLPLKVLNLRRNFLMVIYKLLQLMLRLVKRTLQDPGLQNLGSDFVLKLTLMVKEPVPFLNQFDLVLKVLRLLLLVKTRVIGTRM